MSNLPTFLPTFSPTFDGSLTTSKSSKGSKLSKGSKGSKSSKGSKGTGGISTRTSREDTYMPTTFPTFFIKLENDDVEDDVPTVTDDDIVEDDDPLPTSSKYGKGGITTVKNNVKSNFNGISMSRTSSFDSIHSRFTIF